MNKIVKRLFQITLIGSIISNISCKKEDDIIKSTQTLVMESVTPSEGSIGTEIYIKGQNFESGAKVFVGDIAAAIVEVENATSIFAFVPEGIPANTLLPVKVQNLNGAHGTIANAFKAINPELFYVNSATKPSGNIGSTVILEGKAFGDLQGSGKVLFSDGAGGSIEAVIVSPDDWTETFIVTTVPQGAQNGPVVVKTAIETSNALEFIVTANAAFSPSSINWTVSTALPTAVSGHFASYVPIDNGDITQRFVYVAGGKDGELATLDKVIYGIINTEGKVDSWNSTTALSSPLAFHSSIAATPFNSKVEGNGFLYVLGGTNQEGEVINTVSLAPLHSDGSLGSWNNTTALPLPLHSFGAVIFRNIIYISGGATTDNIPVNKVFKATIDESGNLGDWLELPSMPTARAYHGFVQFGAYLYTVGGETGTVTPDDGNSQSNESKIGEVAYVRIDLRTGNLAQESWTINPNSLQKTRSKHTTLAVGGNLFISSGLYSAATQGSSENVYAQIASDGSIGTFAGATGSNTLLSAGGSNLFNQKGITYIDNDGVGHVMIIGGDNANLPGDKSDKVLFY
jgi:hypothetical protein